VPMLAPVADKLGINLIWFGVLLCVNLQTSFMHPPFGFALFYLRGIADTLFKEKRIPEAVKSNDIYLGSIPWVIMQLILVVVVIFVPQTVTVFLDKEIVVDVDKVKIEIPAEAEAASKDPAAALTPTSTSPATTGTAAENAAADKAAGQVSDKAAVDAQKEIDDLFKDKK
jgi:Tripartite ATP-independent periplasmic transporter, DctM component